MAVKPGELQKPRISTLRKPAPKVCPRGITDPVHLASCACTPPRGDDGPPRKRD